MTFTLNINGKPVRADVDGDTPLLWVLRDSLDLVGTKFGCGGGFCGACTVHVDGRARRACQTAVKDIGAARVTTIEGLSATGAHPVQRAWEEIDVPQCGYCQAGQIMSGRGAPRTHAESNRRRDCVRDVRQSVPLWHLHAYSTSGQTRSNSGFHSVDRG